MLNSIKIFLLKQAYEIYHTLKGAGKEEASRMIVFPEAFKSKKTKKLFITFEIDIKWCIGWINQDLERELQEINSIQVVNKSSDSVSSKSHVHGKFIIL